MKRGPGRPASDPALDPPHAPQLQLPWPPPADRAPSQSEWPQICQKKKESEEAIRAHLVLERGLAAPLTAPHDAPTSTTTPSCR